MFGFGKKLRLAYRSPKWSNIRKAHLENNPFCAACGKNKKLEVHHKIPVHINPEGELDPSNLITLCADPCHIVFGHFLDWKSWNINVVKDCEVYYNEVKNKPLK